jgi:choline dehydrogenase-like flavoprotein
MTGADRHAPQDPAPRVWDVLVFGTGMGGATIGHALARRGHDVLFLEKGHNLLFSDRGDGTLPLEPDESPAARLRRGRWPHRIQGRTNLGDVDLHLPLGCGTGGTTALYAAQLERFLPSDFLPGRVHTGAQGANLPDAWPITYEELLPHYREAERLYRVSGTPDPLQPDAEGSLEDPPPPSPRDAHFLRSFERLGLHPYRAHAGFAWLEGCGECGGVLCPRACKSDAGTICLRPALEDHDAKMCSDCEVLALAATGPRITGVRVHWRGQEATIRGRIVILAAGAFMSPVLLLRSRSEDWPNGIANESGMVGRNLMLHASDFIAIRPRRHLSAAGPKKALALNDFYIQDGRKLGTFQSVGVGVSAGSILGFLREALAKDPRWWGSVVRPFLRFVAKGSAWYFRGATVFATIVEDLPYPDNRIVMASDSPNGFRFEYRYTDELRARNELFRSRLKEVLGKEHRVMTLTGARNLNYGHVCGTCRFGADPATSVLRPDNRAHGVENLYVVDASFFPSSGGTNPSLTIAANALRVTDAVHRSLS